MTDLQKLIDAVENGIIHPSDLDAFIPSLGMNTRANDAHMAYRGSLDAAKARHDAQLPGSDWSAHTSWATYVRVTVSKNGEGAFYGEDGTAHKVGIEARAWLLAILKAYEAQQ